MAVTSYATIDGEILSEKRAGTDRDYLPDPLGSTLALLDNAQAKTDTFTYWPYGEVRTGTGTTVSPFRFVGSLGYYRDSSARTYVRARTYEQSCGRWMSVDPIWPSEAGYGYASNSPLSLYDSTGREATFNPPWLKRRPREAKLFLDCVKDALQFTEECKGLDHDYLYWQMRCIAGCETADYPSNKDPFLTDNGGTSPSDTQGIGPCRLTTQNNYTHAHWDTEYCANAWEGVKLLCKYWQRGKKGFPWTGTTPGCVKRCMKKLWPYPAKR